MESGDREYRITRERSTPSFPGSPSRSWLLQEGRWSWDDYEWHPVKGSQLFSTLTEAKRAAELRDEMSDVDEEYAALVDGEQS